MHICMVCVCVCGGVGQGIVHICMWIHMYLCAQLYGDKNLMSNGSSGFISFLETRI